MTIKEERPTKRFGERISRWLDDAVSVLSPEAGEKRRRARRGTELAQTFHDRRVRRLSAVEDINWDGPSGGGFGSSENSRDGRTWLTSRLSPDAALELDHARMVERSNSAYRNYELAASHVERRVNRVAGCGIYIAPQIKEVEGEITPEQAKKWNPALREAFERWCSQAGGWGLPLYMIQRMVERHVEKDGEAFVEIGDAKHRDPRMPVTLKLRVIHPARIETPPEHSANPKIRQGIEYDDDDDVIAYHVRTIHPGDNKEFTHEYDRIPARFKNGLPRMCHVREKREANQSRGYPQLQVSLKRLKNSEEYEEADLERNIIAACYAAFVRGVDPDQLSGAAAVETDSRGRRIQELSPGRVEYLSEADGVDFANPPGPQAAFVPYMDHQNRMMAAGVVSSYEMMSGDWRGLSYSGGKLIWNDEQVPIDCGQLNMIELLLIPVYQNFVNRCITGSQSDSEPIVEISQGAYKSRPWLYERAKFIPPKRYSLDPARERRAAHADIAAGIIVHSDEVEQMNGRPAEDVYDDIEQNYQARKDRKGVPLDMPGFGANDKLPTQAGDDNPDAEAGSPGREKREEVGAGA